jgi:large subunit ribosomal protein L4
MTSSPLWRGGGRIFPNRPDENFSHKVNRKMFRAGLASILSQLTREERLVVVDTFTVDAPKTKLLTQKLKGMGLANVLIITDAIDDNLHLSSRNLPHVSIITVANTDPVSLMRHDKVIVTRGAVAKIEELFA